MPEIRYLCNSAGEYFARKMGMDLFDPRGGWIDWFPRDDDEAVTTQGEYLGTIYEYTKTTLYRRGIRSSRRIDT